MSVFERCPSYIESNKGSKAGTNSRCPFYIMGVRPTKVSVKRESTIYSRGNFYNSFEKVYDYSSIFSLIFFPN